MREPIDKLPWQEPVREIDTVKLEDKWNKMKDDVLGTMLRVSKLLRVVLRPEWDTANISCNVKTIMADNFNIYDVR